jgi:hypothetical protein
MNNIRCLVGIHDWRYAVMPDQPVVISRACKRCGEFQVKPAETIDQQLSRLDDQAIIGHLFDRDGRPR